MARNEITGFSEVVTAPTWKDGASYVCQLSGLGGLRPNTLVIPWPNNWRQDTQQATDYIRIISLALSEEKAVVCPRNLRALPLGERCAAQTGYIDLWWFITDGGLLVLLTWLLAQHRVWRNCAVRVFVVVENVERETAEEAAQTVRNLFNEKRILSNVTVEAVILDEQMIEPYTYDLTLKIDSRQAMLRHSNVVPHSLDELFMEPVQPAVVESEDSGKRSKLKRMLSKALHPRRSLREHRKKQQEEPLRSMSELFSRRGTITEQSEKDLLDTLNNRCRLRRQELEEQRTGYFSDSECESTLGELVSPVGPTNLTSNTGESMFEKLNQVITSRSKDSSLVLMNLPDVWGTEPDDCASYLAFCECLVKGLDKVVFVHSSGTEVVRIF
jgi:potassium/chloride transporter 4/5/6